MTTIQGGPGDDFLNGTNLRDVIFGEAGNDQAYGGPGNDSMDGGDGNDSLSGGIGRDWLAGQAGDDYLEGDPDDANSPGSNDKLYGGEGNDQLYGWRGDDRLSGAAGDDLLFDDQGANRMFGGAGNDSVNGTGYLSGGTDNDWVSGWGTSRENGGSGADNFLASLRVADGVTSKVTIEDFHHGEDQLLIGADIGAPTDWGRGFDTNGDNRVDGTDLYSHMTRQGSLVLDGDVYGEGDSVVVLHTDHLDVSATGDWLL